MDLDLMFDSFEPFEDMLDQMEAGGVPDVGLEMGPVGEDAFLGDPDVGAELGSLGASAYTKPNVFGGQDTIHEDGSVTWTRPNVFGGQDIYHPDGSMSYTKPNIFGGQDILTLGQSAAAQETFDDIVPDFEVGDRFVEVFGDTGATDAHGLDFATDYPPNLELKLVDPAQLSEGDVDPVSGGVVRGNVQTDSQLVDQQTEASCALMAQEQILEKYLGRDFSEAELSQFAEGRGFYDPYAGTPLEGWDSLLDHAGIPHKNHFFTAGIDVMKEAMKNGGDALVPVDYAEYSGDPYVPEGAGHMVATIGHAENPETGEVIGFYINDSNHAGQVIYKTVEQMERCWLKTVICIKDPTLTA